MPGRDSNPSRPRRPDDDVVKVYGQHSVLAALRARPEAVVRAYIDEGRKVSLGPLMRDLAAHRIAYRVVPTRELERVAASQHHEGACLLVKPRVVPSLEAWVGSCPPAASALVLDGAKNPHNLGAIVRTAAHFGVRGVWIVGSVSLHGALARVAEGGMESVDVFTTTHPVEVLRTLARAGFALIGADQTSSESLYAHRFARRTAFILGAEREGLTDIVRPELETALSIPGTGAVESLNVSTSAAVMVSEYARQRASKRGPSASAAGSRES